MTFFNDSHQIGTFTSVSRSALLAFLLGLLLTGSMAYLLKNRNDAAAQATFQKLTKSTVHDIIDKAQWFEYRLRMVAAMHQTLDKSSAFNSKVFENYIAVLYNAQSGQGLLAFDFVERVPRKDLQRFEQQRRNEGDNNFRISTSGDAQDMYIVKYIEPLAANKAALGIDAGVIAAARENMESAIANKSATLSASFNLTKGTETKAAYIFSLPVFKNPALNHANTTQNSDLVGLFDAVFTPDSIFQTNNSTNTGELEFQILEGSAEQAKKTVFTQLTQTNTDTATAKEPSFQNSNTFCAEEHFSIGGRTFTLRSGSTAIFDQQYASNMPLLVALTGFVLSTFIAFLINKRTLQQQSILQAVISNLPGMVAFWGSDLRCRFANGGYLEYFGRIPGEMDNIHIQNLMSESLFAQNESFIHAALQGKNQSFVRKITKPNGEVAETLTQYISFKDDRLKVLGFIAYITDITQFNIYEKKALYSDVALNTISQGIVVTDNRSVVMYVNSAFTHITGYRADEILGGTTKILQGKNSETAAIHALNKGIATGMAVTQKILNYRKDGSTFWNEMSISPMRDSNGEIIKYVGIIRDISQQVASEHELAQALDTARSSVQSKSLFLANTSHEMRTPLHGLLGMLQLLQKSPLAPQQQEYALAISTAAKSLLEQIDQLLDLSKLEAKKLTINPQPMQLQSLKQETMQWLPILTNNKPVHISFEIDPSISTTLLLADSSRLQQIITNLGSNGIRFTQRGEVRIAIEAKQSTADSCTVLFSIRDTGMGIDEANLQRIFNNFEQADTTNTRLFGGTGLGLPISKQLVELMGGQLEVQSQINEGSHFFFTLTLPVAEQTNKNDDAGEQAPSRQHQLALRNIRILVAEDNLINQKVARMLLESEGAEVTITENGKHAVDAIEQTSPAFDVVLMDLQMPVMDGYAATQAIRQDLGLSDLPIIAMTASATMSDRESCLRASMNAHIAKPFKIEQLTQVILEQLRLQAS